MIIQNRFGRIVSVADELGLSMIKGGEATLYEAPAEIKENTEKKDEDVKNPLECPYCGKVCGNKLGFNKHTEACKKKALSSQS